MGIVRDLWDGVSALLFKDDNGGHALGVVLSDGQGNAALVDGNKALVTISWVHHMVHEGNYFDTVYKTPDGAELADNASLWILIITGDKEFNFEANAVCGGDAEAHLYEDVTASASGTALPMFNLNRISSNVFGGRAFHTPTLASSGTDIFPGGFMAGGTMGQTPGGLIRTNTEREAKPNTAYAFRVINRAGTAQSASITVEGYELAEE